MTRKVLWDIRQWWSVSDTSESPFWSTFFGTHKLPVALCSCILITKCITNFLASLLFPCNFTDSFIFWSLFSSLPWVVVGCPFFLLFVFSSSLVAYFQDVCWTFSRLLADFLYVSILFFFYIVLLKLQAGVVTILRFIPRRRVSFVFHAVYLFNNIKYFWSLLQLYITVKFRKKRRNERTNPELLWHPTLRDIDFDYTSQLLAKKLSLY